MFVSELTILLRVALSNTVSVDLMSYLQEMTRSRPNVSTQYSKYSPVLDQWAKTITLILPLPVSPLAHRFINLHFRGVNGKNSIYVRALALKYLRVTRQRWHLKRVRPIYISVRVCPGTHRWSLSLINACLRVLKWTCVCESFWMSKSGTSGWNGMLTLVTKESHIPAIPIRFLSSHFCSVKRHMDNS